MKHLDFFMSTDELYMDTHITQIQEMVEEDKGHVLPADSLPR